MIVTDTDATERCFFTGLHDSLPEKLKNKILIKVIKEETTKMIQACERLMSYDEQNRSSWIVFDRDQVPMFDEIIEKAESKNIEVGWSNPCFEIWMYAYFGEMPVIHDSKKCCSEFGRLFKQKTGSEYKKSNEQIYSRLIKYGDEKHAIEIAKQKYEQCIRNGKIKPSQMIPCTTVHLLVDEIKGKTK
ncbi:MAG: RloB domain-containing protein [Holdemanella sp.]|nr:RloB domain-containing protein [Holdemanella sp.]